MIGDIDQLLQRTKDQLDSITSDIDPKITTLLHRHLCVVISANIDKSIHIILSEYAKKHGSKKLFNYVSRRYQRGTNYNAQRIASALSLFDPQWGHTFDQEIENQSLKEKIDSIRDIRNAVSHGDTPNVSRQTLDGYFDAQKKLINLLEEIVLGNRD